MTGSLAAARDAAVDALPAHVTGRKRPLKRPNDTAQTTTAPAATGAALLTVSGLSVSYGRVRALDDINLSVRSGELVALAGENGAGKTTLVRCIAGAMAPATGEIFLAGKRVPSDPAGAAKRGVAVVWQDLALCLNLDVAANILLGRESRRLMMSDTRFHAAAASSWTRCASR